MKTDFQHLSLSLRSTSLQWGVQDELNALWKTIAFLPKAVSARKRRDKCASKGIILFMKSIFSADFEGFPRELLRILLVILVFVLSFFRHGVLYSEKFTRGSIAVHGEMYDSSMSSLEEISRLVMPFHDSPSRGHPFCRWTSS